MFFLSDRRRQPLFYLPVHASEPDSLPAAHGLPYSRLDLPPRCSGYCRSRRCSFCQIGGGNPFSISQFTLQSQTLFQQHTGCLIVALICRHVAQAIAGRGDVLFVRSEEATPFLSPSSRFRARLSSSSTRAAL